MHGVRKLHLLLKSFEISRKSVSGHGEILTGRQRQCRTFRVLECETHLVGEHGAGGGEQHSVAGEYGLVGEVAGDGGLADPVGSDQDDVAGLAQGSIQERSVGSSQWASRPCSCRDLARVTRSAEFMVWACG